jgi:hypothetical protein
VVSAREAQEELWRRGRLRWLLYDDQKRIYDWLWSKLALPEPAVLVINIHRQRGKSFIVGSVADEFARKYPGSQIRGVTGTQKALRKIIHPNLRELHRTCPRDLRPRWNGIDSFYGYGNGSELHLAGANDGHADDSRGQRSHLSFVDEAGFVDDLGYLVDSVLLPQALSTGGKIVLISTPPVTPAHDFFDYAMRAEARGHYLVSDITECTHIPEARKLALINEVGGPESTEAQREYFCRFVTDETKAVVPEFTLARSLRIVQPTTPPTYEQPTVAIDVGFADFHAMLYGYWDFRRAKLVIQAEDVLTRATTDKIGAALKATEARCWSEHKSKAPPLRWSDVDLRLIADLWELHGIAVAATAKDDLEAQVNAVRLLVKDEKIEIDPSCVTLIRHLRTAVWKDNRREFERTKNEGHFDAVAALVYMVRNVDRTTNPYPALPEGVTERTHFISPRLLRQPQSEEAQALGRALGRR